VAQDMSVRKTTVKKMEIDDVKIDIFNTFNIVFISLSLAFKYFSKGLVEYDSKHKITNLDKVMPDTLP
jgi:hypothetical protein